MPIKKKGRRHIVQQDVISKITSLLTANSNASVTIKDIEKELSTKISIARIIKNDPSLVKKLLSNAISESKVYQLNKIDDNGRNIIVEYRTPRFMNDTDLKYIKMYDGHIPGTSYFILLKNFSAYEEDKRKKTNSIGFTLNEIYDHLSKTKKIYLNYDIDQYQNKLIPAALKNGHIEQLKPATTPIKYHMTQSFYDIYDLYRRNRKSALSSIGENDDDDDNGNENDDSIGGGNDDSKVSIEPNDNEDDDQHDQDDDGVGEHSELNDSLSNTTNEFENSKKQDQQQQQPHQSSRTLVTKISTKNLTNKNDDNDTSSNSNVKIKLNTTGNSPQPQRVSQRKKIKKTLGPDFLDSFSEKVQMASINYQKSPKSSSSTTTSSSLKSPSMTPASNTQTSSNTPTSSTDKSAEEQSVPKPPPSQPLLPLFTMKKSLIESKMKIKNKIICLVCGKAFHSQRQARVCCSFCDNIAHGKCFRSYVYRRDGINQMVCSICRPQSVCYMCKISERDPEMFVQCVKCLSTYHAHCYREKAHSLCQKCKDAILSGNIPQTEEQEMMAAAIANESSSTTSSSSKSSNNNEGVSTVSTPPIPVRPKVTVAPIKSRSLIQSKMSPMIGGSSSNSGKSLISKPANSGDKNQSLVAKTAANTSLISPASTSNITTDKPSKKIKDEPMETDPPKTTASSIPLTSTPKTSESNSNKGSPAATTVTTTSTTPATATAKAENKTTTLTAVSSSTKSSNETISNNSKSTLTTTTATKKRKHHEISSFEIWNKKPSQSICYNFQTWLETEFRHNCKRYGPDVDLTPLLSLSDTITEWSSENVHCFLATLGFNDEADIFLMKDINGLSLMLLTRYDFLYSLSIKTGPALRLLGIINRLHEEL